MSELLEQLMDDHWWVGFILSMGLIIFAGLSMFWSPMLTFWTYVSTVVSIMVLVVIASMIVLCVWGAIYIGVMWARGRLNEDS